MLILGLALFLALLLARAATAKAPTQKNEDYYSDDIIIKIKDGAIVRPESVTNQLRPERPQRTSQSIGSNSGRHSTRAEKQASQSALQAYLRSKGSPLWEFSDILLQSRYWSTILGICTIEQYGCTKAPYNNYWGIGPGKRYRSIEEGIAAIDSFLSKAETNGKDTIEELNCWYVQPCSQTWLQTVLKTKATLETL